MDAKKEKKNNWCLYVVAIGGVTQELSSADPVNIEISVRNQTDSLSKIVVDNAFLVFPVNFAQALTLSWLTLNVVEKLRVV